jgi:hypothetical protein
MSISTWDLVDRPYGHYQPPALIVMQANSMRGNVDSLSCDIPDDEILGSAWW